MNTRYSDPVRTKTSPGLPARILIFRDRAGRFLLPKETEDDDDSITFIGIAFFEVIQQLVRLREI